MKNVSLVLVATLLLCGCVAQNQPLQLLSGAGPTYPEAARAAGIEGMVVVRYDVLLDGTVANATIVTAQPPGVFDAAALAAVRSWRFQPPMVDGQRRAAYGLKSTIAFEAPDGKPYEAYDE